MNVGSNYHILAHDIGHYSAFDINIMRDKEKCIKVRFPAHNNMVYVPFGRYHLHQF